MPKVTIRVETAGGQNIVLTEGDKLIREVTIECNNPRCGSRHGLDKPKEVSLIDGHPMPEEGRQWLSLILPESSPQYTPMPPNFCGPQCVKDFLTYIYLAPPARTPEIVRETDNLPPLGDAETVSDTRASAAPSPEGDYIQPKMESFSHPVFTEASGIAGSPVSISQADGSGE